MDETIEIKKLNLKDADKVSLIHYDVFKNFFLTSLGLSFLRNFYMAILEHENGIGFGAFKDDKFIGFAIGTTKTAGFYSTILKKKGHKLFISAFWELILKPSKITRLISSLQGKGNPNFNEYPSLLSICVLGNSGVKGVGSSLISAFEMELNKLNYNDLILTTDSDDNDHVNQFYIRNNYICMNSFFNGKRKMNFYHKKLNK